jgi:hypothetical protein
MIPVGGGRFDFDFTVTNVVDTTITGDVWLEVDLPNGTTVSPLLVRSDITLPSGASPTRTLTQSVPGSAPAGYYEYRGRMGLFPEMISYGEGSFNFLKTLFDANQGPYNDWNLEGWDMTNIAELSAVECSPISAHPNPFNPKTVISYQLPVVSLVTLSVYDIRGRKIAELVNGWRAAGVHEVVFDGSGLTAGVYMYRLIVSSGSGMTPTTVTGKMLLLK